MQKQILNLIEKVKINGTEVKAKIDTGADKSSIDESLIDKLGLKATGKRILIKSSFGTTRREIYLAEIEIKGRKFKAEFTTASRKHLNYSVLIGNNILKEGFLIDPSK